MLDGVVLARKTGAEALRRPVLVALGLRHDGKKEVIDYRLARGESAAQWERLLAHLYKARPHRRRPRHDLRRRRLGAAGRPAHGLRKIPVQRCWAHTIRNVLNKVRKADEKSVKADLHAVMNADTAMKARSAARRFAERWGPSLPRRRRLSARRSRRASAFATRPSPNARRCEPPTPSNAASARSAAEPAPWASSNIEPPWTASSSPSSPTKTKCRNPDPSRPDTKLLTSPSQALLTDAMFSV